MKTTRDHCKVMVCGGAIDKGLAGHKLADLEYAEERQIQEIEEGGWDNSKDI